jgi:hypothetical protein
MKIVNRLQNLVAEARKRCLWNLVIEQSALALAAAFGGVLLLLVAGTEILNWYWPALLFAVASGVGIFRLVKRIPSRYTIAQILDRRLRTHDSLSTAWFYAGPEARRGADEAVVRQQREEAAKLATDVAVPDVMPFTMPRTAYAVLALALAAGGLLALRYGIRHSLDLRPPIAEAMFDFFQPGSGTREARNKKPEDKKQQALFSENGVAVGEHTETLPGQLTAESALGEQSPDGLSAKSSPDGRKTPGAKANKQGNDPENSDERDERSAGNSEPSNANNQPGSQAGNPPKQQQSQNKRGNQNQEESSLMQKMREAMANLLDKMKIQPPQPPDGQQTEQASQKGQPSGSTQKSEDPNGKPAPGKPQADGAQEGKQGDEQGEGNERAQGGKSKGERSADERASQDARSGIGKEDGDKGLRDAANQAAMGKLSEIIGKRSQNLTGEIMVEVSSGKQQPLKTQYSDKRATHAEGGGEVHRDEVPLIYQQYVQQYFEEIRKAPAKGKTATGAAQ